MTHNTELCGSEQMFRQMNNLWRLRISHLLFGMMFFYGIEQVFLNETMDTTAARGYTTIAFIVSMLIFDIPTGIFADKIGRKKSMLAACGFSAISLLVLGISSNLTVYILGIVLFGMYVALVNGSSQALLYDWLAEQNKTKLYAKYQGSIYAMFLIGATVANAASGFIANEWGLRSNYFLSIIPASILACVVILGITEPTFHKKQDQAWFSHLTDVVNEIRNHRAIILYSVRFTMALILIATIGEFGQIYALTFGISTVLLGVFWSITSIFAASGRALAHRVQNYPRAFLAVTCVALGAFAITENRLGIGLFWIAYGLIEALANIAETEIQHATSSAIRATTFSVISFAGNAIAIPVVLLYTHFYTVNGIFITNKILLGICIVVLLVSILVPVRQSKHSDTT